LRAQDSNSAVQIQPRIVVHFFEAVSIFRKNGDSIFGFSGDSGWRVACLCQAMQSLDNIYLKLYPTLEASSLAQLHENPPPPEPQREISRDVAHELNNVLTIIRGYTERLLFKNAENPALRADLQLICDNAKRAENVIRQAARGQRNRPVTT
jgi:signal transduction histidine kinase